MNFKTPAIAAAAFILGAVAIPGIASAQDDPSEAQAEAPAVSAEVVDASEPDGLDFDSLFDVEFDGDFGDLTEDELAEFENYQPTPEELAEWNAETDQLVQALTEAGIKVQVETDETGLRYATFGENLTDEQWEKVEDVMSDAFGEMTVIDLDELPDAFGEMTVIDLDELSDGFGEMTVLDLDELSDAELAELENYQPTAEELAEWNAQTDKLIAELEAAGVPVQRSVEDGFVVFDIPADLTPEQEAVFAELLSDCPEDEGDHGDEAPADDVEGGEVEGSSVDA